MTWALKRLPLPQFRAHGLLQWTICWFCRNFVSPEANLLILRHFATESNLLNFLRDNSGRAALPPLELYPRKIDDLLRYTFVDHDQELFRMMQRARALGPVERARRRTELDWTHWRPIDLVDQGHPRRWTQMLDFETSHALFMCLFCFLLTADEYRDSINGFNLDQSIAHPHRPAHRRSDAGRARLQQVSALSGRPWNLAQRFLMHGFFTEYLHARLEQLRAQR